ncbi:MAG: zf-HC2 domain-containing protein, partial [Candidatus Eremiobacteraeota bacterium]|nr:zf-HC2 domain-containing protein [Candidatus Eremiobacteraeota bacterium]
MRCLACELLLDAYLERELPPRTMRAVANHLRRCPSCTAMLAELRVVDGLLATTKPVELPPNFAHAAMAQVHSLPKPRRSGGALWIALVFYVVCAWIAAWVAAIVLRGGWPLFGTGFFYRSVADVIHGGPWEALVGTLRAFTPLGPLVAPAVAIALILDLALAGGVLFFYRAIRPWLAAQL